MQFKLTIDLGEGMNVGDVEAAIINSIFPTFTSNAELFDLPAEGIVRKANGETVGRWEVSETHSETVDKVIDLWNSGKLKLQSLPKQESHVRKEFTGTFQPEQDAEIRECNPNGLLECYCHNGHEQNNTVCMYCYIVAHPDWPNELPKEYTGQAHHLSKAANSLVNLLNTLDCSKFETFTAAILTTDIHNFISQMEKRVGQNPDPDGDGGRTRIGDTPEDGTDNDATGYSADDI